MTRQRHWQSFQRRKHALAVDVCVQWSCACMLFIMISGSPPFGHAAAGDWWFDAIRANRLDLFWDAHEREGMVFPAAAKGTLTSPTENLVVSARLDCTGFVVTRCAVSFVKCYVLRLCSSSIIATHTNSSSCTHL